VAGLRKSEGDFLLMVDDLYQETILDHSKRPRNFHAMDDANRKAKATTRCAATS
jgi:NifU-like protein involved in Fe-S cluster formation